MNPALIELIILAGIAVFLFLRLRSVLGTREGFEKPRMQPKNDAPKNIPRAQEQIQGPTSKARAQSHGCLSALHLRPSECYNC